MRDWPIFLMPEQLGNLNLTLTKEPLDPIEKKKDSLPFLDVLATPFYMEKRFVLLTY